MAKIPFPIKPNASDTLIVGRTAAEADRKALDNVKRTKTAYESNRVDNQGNKLDDTVLAVLRDRTRVRPDTIPTTPRERKKVVYSPPIGSSLKTKYSLREDRPYSPQNRVLGKRKN